MVNVTHAIIPVAGFGTRRLPITKSIEKCMLPICNRPIIDYTVEQCILAGVTNIFFVVSPEHHQLRSYYSSNVSLEWYLKKNNKLDYLELIKPETRVNFHYIVQEPTGPYGTAVPLWLARSAVKDSPHFIVTMGDDFIYNPMQPHANLRNLIQAIQDSQAQSGLLGVKLKPERIRLYSAINSRREGKIEYFESMIEKPQTGTPVGEIANVSKYIFDQEIFRYVAQVMHKPNQLGEHFLTDAVNLYSQNGNSTVIVRAVGQYLDGGSLSSWIEANNSVYESIR